MNNVKRILFLSFLLSSFLSIPIYAQIWPKVYLQNYGTLPWSVIEHYDKGYLIGGWNIASDGYPINGLLIKTNINGDFIWNKTIGNINDKSGIYDINNTADGGSIIAGLTMKYDSWGDPFIMKLNPCGESEWCRIYTVVQDRFDHTTAIRQVPGGYIACVILGYELTSNNKLWLYRLDNNGDLIWQQLYGQTDTAMRGAEGEDMTVTPDNKYLISGWCYYPDSGIVWPKSLRPLLVKVDSAGSLDWEIPWDEIHDSSFRGEAYRSIVDNNHTIYSCGRHIESSATPPGDRPTMMKTSPGGNEISYHDLVPDSWQAVFFNLNWFQDSTIEIDGGWSYSYADPGQLAVFKIDRNGNILDSVNIMETPYCFSDAIVDHDNKVFLVQPLYSYNQWRSYSWKLNSDLELDSLYTRPMVYDSLCPHPIVSDTIPLDCEVVGLDEPLKNPETGQLKVYPNPVGDILHIEIPPMIKTVTPIPSYDVTTVYHHWDKATLEIYDLFGKKLYSSTVRQNQPPIGLDVSAWNTGMYLVRLVYNGQTADSKKVVKK